MIKPCFKFCQSPLVILLGILSQSPFDRIWAIISAPCSTIVCSNSLCVLVTLVACFKKINKILTSSLQDHLSWRISDSISYVTIHERRSFVYSLGSISPDKLGVNFEMRIFENTICLLSICYMSSGLFSIRRLTSSTWFFVLSLSFSRISIVSCGVRTGGELDWVNAGKLGCRKQLGSICLRLENSLLSAVKWFRSGNPKWVKSTPLLYVSFTTFWMN